MKSAEATVFDRKSGAAEGPAVRPGSRTKVSVPLVLPQNRHPERSRGTCGSLHEREKLGAPLPRFPAKACGVDTLHPPFLNERRTRGPLWHSVPGNRGQARFWLEWGYHSTRRAFLSH